MILRNVTNSKLILILFMINPVYVFNAQKFNYVTFNGSMTPCGYNFYTNPIMEIISPSRNVLTWVSICRVTAPLIIIFLL